VLNLLVVSTWWPCPPDNGSRLRAYHLLRELSKQCRITLVGFGDPSGEAHIEPLRAWCDRVEAIRPTRDTGVRHGFRGLLSPVPRHYVQTESAAMRARVAALVASHDAALGLQIDAARYLVDHRDLPRVFEEVEVTMLREQFTAARGPARLRHGMTWWKFRRFIRSLVDAVDRATVVSAEEREQLRQIGCDVDRVAIVPNGVEAQAVLPPARRAERLIYPGSVTYSANLDAVRYFVRDILPLIRRVRPGMSVWVTGATDGVDVSDLTVPGVTFTGRLPDIRQAIAESAACVVPLRVGGGTRLKVLEAMALGTPVVSTPKGIEGLDVAPERHVMLAESPQAFASQVLRLLDDPILESRLTRDARQLMNDRYEWAPIGDALVGDDSHSQRRHPDLQRGSEHARGHPERPRPDLSALRDRRCR
jgi:polysaccharide biosynthesis protein PslH